MQAGSCHIRNATKTNAAYPFAIFLGRNCNNSLVFRQTTDGAFFLTAPIGFVHLNRSPQAISPRSHHCPTKFVQPCPGRYVASQAQHLLQTHRPCTVFLTGNVPDRSKPHSQRLVGVLENRARRDGSLIAACPANQTSPRCRPISRSLAMRANKAARPAQANQVVPTRLLRRKSFFQFHNRPRIIFHNC